MIFLMSHFIKGNNSGCFCAKLFMDERGLAQIKVQIKTDINRDIMRAAAPAFRLTTVAAISINNTWSALRFRLTDKVGKK